MSTSRHGRGVIRNIFKNFFDSFKVKSSFDKNAGSLIGTDPFGNKYYEIPADPSRGKRHPRRWFVSPETMKKEVLGYSTYGGFDSDKPAEWESWLRHRREDPPTEEQVLQSLALADLKKRNAAKLEEKRIEELKALGRYTGPPEPQEHEKAPYPTYGLEMTPGDESKEAEEGEKWREFKNPYFDEKTGKAKE